MLAKVETPLQELTKKDVLFHWDKPQETAFEQLKNLCCKAPDLAYYDINKDVAIQCDASQSAVGAVLLQEGRPVAYASHKLRPSEWNWAPIDRSDCIQHTKVQGVHTREVDCGANRSQAT